MRLPAFLMALSIVWFSQTALQSHDTIPIIIVSILGVQVLETFGRSVSRGNCAHNFYIIWTFLLHLCRQQYRDFVM